MSVPTWATVVSSLGQRRHHRQAPDGGYGSIRLEWIDVFETGNLEIDTIHRKLILDCNRLLALVDNEASWSLIVDEARRFLERCIEHFRSEESLLECTKFPRYAEHVAEHRRMESEMQALLKRMEQVDGSLEEHRDLPRSLGPDLIELMIRHDLDYRSHLLHQQGR
jgi:hemerythrin-like metal-binding protein